MNPQLFHDLAASEESSGYPENARALRAVPDVVAFLRDIEPWLTHNAEGMVDDGWSLAPEYAAAARAALAKLESKS